MLEVAKYTSSKSFFELDPFLFSANQIANSRKGRFFCFFLLLKKIGILPFALLGKGIKTSFRVFGIVLGFSSILLSLGLSSSSRNFFKERMEALAADISDWIVYPFGIAICLIRLILAITIHPRIYLNYD